MLLDARAPVVGAVRPTDLGDGFALLDLLGGMFPDAARAVGRLRDGLGLYAFSRGELAESGIDPDALVIGAWGIADGDERPARSKRRDRAAGADAGRGPALRHRFVLKVLDGERLLRSATAILTAADASVARLSGAGPALPAWAAARPLQAQARKAGVVLLARGRDGTLVAVRRIGALAVVDYAEASRSGSDRSTTGSDRSTAAALSRLIAPPRQPLSAALAQGTRRLLASDDVSIALVVEPSALPPLLRRPSCRKDWGQTDAELFENAALLLRLHPFQWRMQVVWALTPLGKTRLAGAASDDGLVDPSTAAADGIASAGLLLDRFEAVRGAPRPPVLAGKAQRAHDSLEACGLPAWLSAAVRFWPQLAALEVESLVAPVKAAAVLGDLRNVAAVVRQLPDGRQPQAAGWEASTVLLGSLPAAAEATVTGLLAQQASGNPERQGFGDRVPTFFDLSAATGFSEAGLERIAAGHVALALTPQSSGLGWYYRLPRRAAHLGPQSRIGYLHLNLAHLLESWAEEADQGTRAAVRLAAGQLGQLGGNLALDGDFVRLDLDLSGSQ